MESAATRVLVSVASGLFGLAVGSFLNVVIYRLPRFESISSPPSHCPRCNSPLRSWENIPVVSWIALGGRCSHCDAPISPRYPLVELGTAVLFVSVALTSSGTGPLAPLDAMIAATIAIGVINLDGERVPKILGYIVFTCSASLIALSLAEHHPGWLKSAGAAAVAALVAWLVMHLRSQRSDALLGFSGLASLVGWGWAAGWTGAAGGWIFATASVTLGILVAITSRRHLLATMGATIGIVALIIGSAVGR